MSSKKETIVNVQEWEGENWTKEESHSTNSSIEVRRDNDKLGGMSMGQSKENDGV